MENTSDTLPEYKQATNKLAALWDSLKADPVNFKPGLSVRVINAVLRAEQSKDEKPWDHVALEVVFTRFVSIDRLTVKQGAEESFTWRMGLGLIDWKEVFKRGFAYGIGWSEREKYRMRGIHGFTSEHMAAIVGSSRAVLNLFAKTVNPAEVLGRVCSDANSANQPFESWCGDFGYDSDSISALETYRLCQSQGLRARRLIDTNTFDKLAELTNAL